MSFFEKRTNVDLIVSCFGCFDQISDEEIAWRLQEQINAEMRASSSAKAQSTNPNANTRNINVLQHHMLPSGAQIGPFGAITAKQGDHRVYLAKAPNGTLEWAKQPPRSPQSWVLQDFPWSVVNLPKMAKHERQQIEQLYNYHHQHQDDSSDTLSFAFEDQLQLKKQHTENKDNKIVIDDEDDDDIEILAKDEEYARQLQETFDQELAQHQAKSSNVGVSHNGYVDFEKFGKPIEVKKNAHAVAGDEDRIPFHFQYDGMHSDGNDDIYSHLRSSEDQGSAELSTLLNQGLRQNEVEPLQDKQAPGLTITLFDHQKKGVAWMLQMEEDNEHKGGFLCDQMGVGKTIQIIALMLGSRHRARERKREEYEQNVVPVLSEEDEKATDSENDKATGLNGFIVTDDVIDFRCDADGEDDTDVDGDDEESVESEILGDSNPKTKSNVTANEINHKKAAMDMDVASKKEKSCESDGLFDDILEEIHICNKEAESEGVFDDIITELNASSIETEKEEKKKKRPRRARKRSELVIDKEEDESDTVDEEYQLRDLPFEPDEGEETVDEDDELCPLTRNKKSDIFNSFEPAAKKRKLNNHGNKNKKRGASGNATCDKWYTGRSNFGVRAKPWLNVKQRTLIVGPLAIIDQWAQEIKEKTQRREFKVVVYYGPGRKSKFRRQVLRDYDVVITTYGHVSSEYANGNEEKQSGLFKLPRNFFYRVVLDEAHIIKNGTSKQSKACAEIGNRGVKVRWCLTGTPIQNKLLDLFPLCRFLQIRACGTKRDFKKTLSLPNNGGKGNVSGQSKMKVTAFLAAHMLRRLKSEVVDNLVSKTEEVVELEFDEAEGSIYKSFQSHARTKFNKFVKAGVVKKNYANILVLLLRLRQISDHPYLALKPKTVEGEEEVGEGDDSQHSDNDNQTGDPLEKIDKKIIKRINNREDCILDSECPICLDVFNDGVMFRECGHLICKEHLYDLNEQCPECRTAFKVNKVISFNVIIRSSFIDGKHKNSMLVKEELIMDGEIIAEKMKNSNSPHKKKRQRTIVWRKVARAKGTYRSKEQIKEDEKAKLRGKNETKEEKLRKLQRKFEWDTYKVDEKWESDFKDDTEDGYKEDDKYPDQDNGWNFVPSSKTKMMLQKIQWIRKHRPNDKIIVFSQFRTMLSVLERVLRKHKLNYLMYHGGLDRNARNEVIYTFKKDEQRNEIPVMLMSLKCASLGLNLTVANHVIFVDLWWNPAVERQAIDRVHRIGQKKHVFVTRMIIKDSVEERILDLQRDKQKIADSALDGANFAKQNRLSIADLARLFGSDQHIIQHAERQDGRSVGFSRDSLMNIRPTPMYTHNPNHNYIHNHHISPPAHAAHHLHGFNQMQPSLAASR